MRSGTQMSPSGWRGPKTARTATSTTSEAKRFTSAESTLDAGSSCTGMRTRFTIAPFATTLAAPPWSELAKKVQGTRPVKRKMG